MSAIFGRVEFSDKPVDPDAFSSSFEKVRVYGPDRSDFWSSGSVALGRHLLQVAPASWREKPVEPTDGLVIVADAILDNREELAEKLGISRPELASLSDTDVIGHSYRRWGHDCASHLVGDFAFAAISLETRSVFLARDHIGARPLFWALRDRTFLFGTAVAPILGCREWRWPVDECVIAEYLSRPGLPVSKPFFTNISRVPAGSCLSATAMGIRTERWWQPSTAAVRHYKSDRDAIAAACEHLERAVVDRVNTDGAVGAHFSGGMDSTVVTVIAARTLRSRGASIANTYTWSPPISDGYPADPSDDERLRIQEIAELEKIPVAFGSAHAENFLNFIDRPLEVEGEADLADELPVLQRAKADGLRIMLSGWGGDEAFSNHGRGFLSHLLLRGKFSEAAQFIRLPMRSFMRPKVLLRLFWNEVVKPLLPGAAAALAFPTGMKTRIGTFVSAALREKHPDSVSGKSGVPKFGMNPNRNLKSIVSFGHLTMRMESWAEWSAPFAFQYRYPLTDRRLLEFLFTLPPDQLFFNNQPRGLARAVVARYTKAFGAKRDIANERLRRDTRDAVWRDLAQDVERGKYDDDCPWIDTAAFRATALTPTDQEQVSNIVLFNELFAAARIWALYRRAGERGWL